METPALRRALLTRFAWLYRHERPRLLRGVAERMGPRLRARVEPEDLLQQAAVTALGHLSEEDLADPVRFRRWFLKLAEHELYATVRRHRVRVRPRRTTPLAQEALQYGALGPEGEPWVDGARQRDLTDREDLSRLAEDLADLRLDPRITVTGRDFLGLSWETLSFLTGDRSDGATRKLYARARGRLLRRD